LISKAQTVFVFVFGLGVYAAAALPADTVIERCAVLQDMYLDRRPLRTSPGSRSQGSNRRSPSSVQTLPHRPHGSADRIACCAAHVTAAPRRATTPGSPRKPLCSRCSGRRPRGQRSNLAGACSATAPRRHRRAAAQPHRFSSRQASLVPFRGVVSRPPCPRGPPSRGRPWGTAITHFHVRWDQLVWGAWRFDLTANSSFSSVRGPR
jgi:hypothetical protein